MLYTCTFIFVHEFFHAEGGFISLRNILCTKCLLILFVENEIKYIEGFIFLELFDYVLKSKINHERLFSLRYQFYWSATMPFSVTLIYWHHCTCMCTFTTLHHKPHTSSNLPKIYSEFAWKNYILYHTKLFTLPPPPLTPYQFKQINM